MASFFRRFFLHLFVLMPVIFFLFIGVPLETHIRGLDGFFSTSQDVGILVRQHLFFEAAACFYCITILLEVVVILSRPHLRSREKVPVAPITWISVVLGVILTAAYIHIRANGESGTLENAQPFLIVMILTTTIIALGVHAVDHLSSSEVAPRPKAKVRAESRK